MLRVITALFICLIVSSCSQKESPLIVGHVIDITDKEPIPGAVVGLVSQEPAGLFTYSEHLVDSCKADEKGTFLFMRETQAALMCGYADRYYDNCSDFNLIFSNVDDNYVTLMPKAWLAVSTEDIDNDDPDVTVSFQAAFQGSDYMDVTQLDESDPAYIGMVQGNRTVFVYGSLNHADGTQEQINFDVWCDKHDTTHLVIEY